MTTPSRFDPRHFLCPFDFSDLSALALKYAAAGALQYRGRLTVFHAEYVDLPRYFAKGEFDRLEREIEEVKGDVRARLKERVEAVLGAVPANLRISYEVRDSHPVEGIMDRLGARDVDMVIMGTHGTGGIRRLVLGSVARHVFENASVPVFTVRQKTRRFIPPEDPAAQPKLDRILCAVDLETAEDPSIQAALSFAERFGSRLTVLYADPSRRSQEEIDALKGKICRQAANDGNPRCELQAVILRGNPAEQILRHAEKTAADLIVVGGKRRPELGSVFLGRVTDLVVRHASVPVLVMPRNA